MHKSKLLIIEIKTFDHVRLANLLGQLSLQLFRTCWFLGKKNLLNFVGYSYNILIKLIYNLPLRISVVIVKSHLNYNSDMIMCEVFFILVKPYNLTFDKYVYSNYVLHYQLPLNHVIITLCLPMWQIVSFILCK